MQLVFALLCQDALDLRPDAKAEWGASIADVRQVLAAAGRELRKHFPERTFPPIEVAPKGGPITLFKRGPKGEIRVKLDVAGPFWAQYTFQFAHELGHIVCGYDDDPHPQKWFEESLCETASLYVLRRSAETWKSNPPYANWKGYSTSLAAYAEERLQKATIPDGLGLAAWYAANKAAWEANAEDRPRNLIIAAQLLPLFEADPRRWESLTWLNTETLGPKSSFAELLAAWEKHSPDRHKPFVREVRRLFVQ